MPKWITYVALGVAGYLLYKKFLAPASSVAAPSPDMTGFAPSSMAQAAPFFPTPAQPPAPVAAPPLMMGPSLPVIQPSVHAYTRALTSSRFAGGIGYL